MTDRIDFGGEPWKAIPLSTLRDPRLSYKAKGGLATLLSHGEGWVRSSIAMLQREGRCGRTEAKTIMRELVAEGYATMEQSHGPGGRFTTGYTVHAIRQVSGGEAVVSPGTDEPATVEPGTVGLTAVVEALDVEALDVETQTQELAPSTSARPRDEVWDVLVAIYGHPTGSGKGSMNAAAKTLRDYEAAPADIEWMARTLGRTDLGWAVVTPTALAKHFGERHALVAQLDKKPYDRAAAIANGDLG